MLSTHKVKASKQQRDARQSKNKEARARNAMFLKALQPFQNKSR
jgi:hypothetical protein